MGDPALFSLTDNFELGIQLYQYIQERMVGRIATEKYGCGALAAAAAYYPHDMHIEIGTMFGGTAILAALAKKAKGGNGKVVVIDPLTKHGYYGGRDDQTGIRPTPGIFWENAKLFGVEDMIEFHDDYSYPFPYAVQGLCMTAFIDGNHDHPVVFHDWLNIRKRAAGYVLFDNVDRAHPDVIDVFRFAQCDPEWELVSLVNCVGVLKFRESKAFECTHLKF